MVVSELENLMGSEATMTVPVLECLANLSLSPKLLDHSTNTVMNMVASCEREDLPAVVRFLLKVRAPCCAQLGTRAQSLNAGSRRRLRWHRQAAHSGNSVNIVREVRKSISFILPQVADPTPEQRRDIGACGALC